MHVGADYHVIEGKTLTSKENLEYNLRFGVNSMMRRLCLALLFLLLCSSGLYARPVALFYMTNRPDSIQSFLAHSAKIDLLVPTWYTVDANGLVTGGPNPMVLETTRREGLPVMPIVSQSDERSLAGKAKFHALAGSVEAQDRMNEALLREARLHGYRGFQFDFEYVSYLDRNGLTAVVERTAEALHKAGLKLTIAVMTTIPYAPGAGGFAKWNDADRRGEYDLGALAKYVDLICLMTYDQHGSWEVPGPVAGWQWTLQSLDYAQKSVPKAKLSLGIPLYGFHWYTGAPTVDKATGRYTPNLIADYISTPDALQLATKFGGKLESDGDGSDFFYFYRDQLREWVFYTSQRSFRERYQSIADRGLEGFCAWVLGQEDPQIWTLLPDRGGKR
jgi:spore germination protein YaaH